MAGWEAELHDDYSQFLSGAELDAAIDATSGARLRRWQLLLLCRVLRQGPIDLVTSAAASTGQANQAVFGKQIT